MARRRLILGATALSALATACGSMPGDPREESPENAAEAWTSGDAITGFGGKCLSTSGYTSANGTQLILWDCLGQQNQKWVYLVDGTIRGFGGKCVTADGPVSNGTRLVLSDCVGAANQTWSAADGGAIVGLGGKCVATVTGYSSANGTGVGIWECDPRAPQENEKWQIPAKPASAVVDTVTAMQPGWVRVGVSWSDYVGNPRVTVTPTCADGTSNESVRASMAAASASSKNAIVDLRVSDTWLIENDVGGPAASSGRSTKLPCHVTALRATIGYGAGWPVETAYLAIDFAMDTTIQRRRPWHIAGTPITDTVARLRAPIYTRRYAAYPPRVFAVRSSVGAIGFLEVEELPGRGTLGVRGLQSSDPSADGSLDTMPSGLDFNGGAEVYDGWGIDIDRRGVTRDTVSAAEESNPGVTTFGTGSWSADRLDAHDSIFPAPPLFTEATYESRVLGNHGVPRRLRMAGSMGSSPYDRYDLDVVYDASAHQLVAINGATITALDLGGPIQPSRPPIVSTAPPGAVTPAMPIALLSPAPAGPASSCALTKTGGAWRINATASTCNGLSAGSSRSWRCPTRTDTFDPESMAPAPGNGAEASVYSSLSPVLRSRLNNLYGDCGTQSFIQDKEALLNRVIDDVVPKRGFMVNGYLATVAEPPIGLSPSANHWNRYRDYGLHGDADTGVPNVAAPDGDLSGAPQMLDAYWPTRELWFWDWQTAAASWTPSLASCTNSWFSGYCMAQGNPPPGVYWNYTQMAASRGSDPFKDGAWSVGNALFPVTQTDISLGDRDAAIQQILTRVDSGIPVRLGFASGFTGSSTIPDASIVPVAANLPTGWALPPELSACDPSLLSAAFKLAAGGHALNIVGYSLAGSRGSPDPAGSYFILQNNWGYYGGREGFYTMNFAAFKWLASSVRAPVLDATCASPACARH